MAEVSADEVRTLLRALYNQAIDGNTRSAALLLAYLCGKPPGPMNARELYPTVRTARAPTLTLEGLSARLQALLEDFEAGKVAIEETRIMKDILTALAQARQASAVEDKLDELRLAMERAGNGEQMNTAVAQVLPGQLSLFTDLDPRERQG